MARLLFVLLIMSLTAGPLRAATDCAAAPSARTCLVDEAMAQAALTVNAQSFIHDLTEIATLVEKAGALPARDLVTMFFAQLDREAPYGSEQLHLLTRLACSRSSVELGPAVAAAVADRLEILQPQVTREDRRIFDDDLDATATIVKCRARAGDLVAVDAILRAHPDRAADLAAIAGQILALAGDGAAARRLHVAYPGANWGFDGLNYWLFRGAAQTGDIANVMATLREPSSPADLLRRLRNALRWMPDPSHQAELQAFAEELASDRTRPLPLGLFGIVVTEPAKAGDWADVLGLIERLEPGGSNEGATVRALAMLAGASGTYEVIFDLLGQPEPFSAWRRRVSRIYAAAFEGGVAAGRDDLDRIVDATPEPWRNTALLALGSARAKAGDLRGAFDVLTDLADRSMQQRDIRPFLEEFALALAHAGHWQEAARLARRSGDPVLLARVALHAPH
ncbi:hypothetical protein [Jannaschia marina]|uniref:hypothetical protein n=1 Tax=Jannaschia marina TaxID=2741674 RepID=UPI0015CC74B2|nr:hypothetical protein [Jannaschia marina]